jgi:hypothetical protein
MSLCVHDRTDCLCGRPKVDRIDLVLQLADMKLKFDAALDLARRYGGIDGAHHKMWTIAQMVRALCGSEEVYKSWVTEYRAGSDGPETYSWDEGIAP